MYSFEQCEKHFECLGEGSSRLVYALDNSTVLKLPTTHGGYWQNQNEIELFKKYKNTVLPLCPLDIGKSSKDFIVMERAFPLADLGESNRNLVENFDKTIVQYIDNCTSLYKTRLQKNEYIELLLSKKYDPRIIEFVKRISMFQSKVIEKIFYDVVSFNCGLWNNQIVVLDYGYPYHDSNTSLNSFVNTSAYDAYINADDEKSLDEPEETMVL